MNLRSRKAVAVFALEILIYGGLVALYLFMVVHFLTDWILEINEKNRQLYALLSLLLIIAQGLILENVTTTLLNWFRPKME